MNRRITCISLMMAWLTLGSNPATAGDFMKLSDPRATTHWLKSGESLFGFNANAGGYLSCLKLGPNAKKGSYCPSSGASMQNLAAPGYGRGWQLAIRDKLHNGRHNPTQAGFRDSCGAPITMSKGQSCSGPGGRLYMPPFALPLFSDPVFDFTQHEDLCPDSYSGDGNNSDNDGLPEGGLSQVAEVSSEWDYAGYYEDASDLVSADVAILRHVLQVDYVRTPASILQFGNNAVKDDGSAVLNTAAIWNDLAPDSFPPDALNGPQVATATDYASGIFVYSGRIRQSQGYNQALWLDGNGAWQSASVSECNSFRRVQVHDDQFKELFDGNPNSLMGGSPAAFDDFTDHPLLVLSTGGINEVNTASAVGIYIPTSSPCNAAQTVGVETASGDIVYEQDRRSRLLLTAQRRACGNDDGGKAISTMGPPDDPVSVENDMFKFAVRLYFLGVLAPENGVAGVHERLRMDLYLLTGTPAEIREAYETLKASGTMAQSDCRVTQNCLPIESPPPPPPVPDTDPPDAGDAQALPDTQDTVTPPEPQDTQTPPVPQDTQTPPDTASDTNVLPDTHTDVSEPPVIAEPPPVTDVKPPPKEPRKTGGACATSATPIHGWGVVWITFLLLGFFRHRIRQKTATNR